MSFLPDREEHGNSFQVPHAPPIRKLFLSSNSEDLKTNTNENDTFKVFLRIKPNSDLNNSNDCISIHDCGTLVCKPPPTSKFKKLEKVEYSFSHIFGPKTTQAEIFSKCVVNCVEDLLLARNGLIFTYGTTNAGKTFTVQGSAKSPGIIPQVLHTLFCNIKVDQSARFKPYLAKDILKLESSTSRKELQVKSEILRTFRSNTKSSKQSTLNIDSSQFMQALQKSFIELKGNYPTCSVWLSFLEVYNETIYDLLDSTVSARKPLKLAADLNDNFYVKELKQIYVGSAEEAFAIYQFGKRNLNIASTKMNENSSRSHCIFTIHLINLDNDDEPVVSKLSICDLAGTERLTKTQNTGMRLKEAGNINGSLFQLNRCLRAIRENQTKQTNQLIPYRQSNLTKLLHSALDDRTDEKSIMIVNINPAAELFDETQQVLKMCATASKIRNKPITKKRPSSRFSTYIYGRNEDRNHDELSYSEDGLTKEIYCSDIQELHEKLLRQEEEIEKLKSHVKVRENYHENTKRNLKEFCEKIETTYKSRVKSLEERLKSQKEYYLWKITDVKKNTLLESICDEAIREELSKKDASILELEKKLIELKCEDDDKKSLLTFDLAVKEELSKKDAQIEELEKKIVELQHDDHCRNLSSSEEIHEKDIKIEELESLIQEAKSEYLLIEKKFELENAKVNELENELSDKNEAIEQYELHMNAKQNIIEELEQEIEVMKEKLNQNTIEHEEILHELEKSRDQIVSAQKVTIEELNKKIEELDTDWRKKVTARKNEIDKLNEKLAKFENDKIRGKKMQIGLEKKIEKLNQELREVDMDLNEKLAVRENQIEKLNQKFAELTEHVKNKFCSHRSEFGETKHNENVNSKPYNTRRNNKTPSGKENRLLAMTPGDAVNKSSKKGRGKAKIPLYNAFDDSLEANVFRVIPEKETTCTNLNDPPKSEKKKLFSDLLSPNQYSSFHPNENTLSTYSVSPDLHARDYESSRDLSRFVQMATPLQTVKSMKKKK